MMKIFLDDERLAPIGCLQVRWPDEITSYLAKGVVTGFSLDHDLGDDARGTGYDVLLWIEQAIVDAGFQPPKINEHTSNPAARIRMLAAVEQNTCLAEMKSQ